MGFKSRFPGFNQDEVAPSEPDPTPDVESRIGRVLARLQGFSNILGIFKFLRSDYNGRLHVTQAPTDFENINPGIYVTINGTSNMLAANPDRQVLFIADNAAFDVAVYIVVNGLNVFFAGLLPGDILTMTGFTQAIAIGASTAGGQILYFEV